MKAVGIIAEYNPLHKGHVYHLEEARRLAGAQAVVVAMSGNFVQRGEPAILDKWTRSQHAISNGADLVVEIPVLYSLGNAAQYASAGISLLESLSCVQHLAFGSESGNIDALLRVSNNLKNYASSLEEGIALASKEGMSYPAAREAAYRTVFADSPQLDEDISVLSNPNDILAVEYLRACTSMEPLAIKRCGAAYCDELKEGEAFQSASAIRQAIYSGKAVDDFVPPTVLTNLINIDCSMNSKWFDLLRYAIISTDAATIDNCPSGGEGLGNKLKNSISDANSLDELILLVKSKKYTYSRLSRLCSQLVLGIDRTQLDRIAPQYVRILAFNNTGRELLAEIKKSGNNTLPIITNIARESKLLGEDGLELINLESKAADIYNAINSKDLHLYSEYRRNPSN